MSDPNRRTFLRAGTALGSIFIVGSLAGCSDSTDSGSGTDDSGPSNDDSGTDEGNVTDDSEGDRGSGANDSGTDGSSGSASADLGTPVTPGQYRMMSFGGPVTLEYETISPRGSGTLMVDVRDVDGNAATLDLRYTAGDFAETATVSGDFDHIYGGLYSNVPEQLVYSLFIGYSNRFHGRQLAVGEEWGTVTGLPGDNRITITGTESHAGVECYVAEITVDDDPFATLCLRPGFGIPVHSVIYDQDGAITREAKLASYDQP